MRAIAKDIDSYISESPKEAQAALQQVRATIKKAAPEAEETIKYAMPTFTLNGNLAHFAAFKSHIGFYPAPTGIKAFEKQLPVYKTGKGSIQFPLGQPMPLELIEKMVAFRVKENSTKAKKKK